MRKWVVWHEKKRVDEGNDECSSVVGLVVLKQWRREGLSKGYARRNVWKVIQRLDGEEGEPIPWISLKRKKFQMLWKEEEWCMKGTNDGSLWSGNFGTYEMFQLVVGAALWSLYIVEVLWPNQQPKGTIKGKFPVTFIPIVLVVILMALMST